MSRPDEQIAMQQVVHITKAVVQQQPGQVSTISPPPGFRLVQVLTLPKSSVLEAHETVLCVFIAEQPVRMTRVARATSLEGLKPLEGGEGGAQ